MCWPVLVKIMSRLEVQDFPEPLLQVSDHYGCRVVDWFMRVYFA